MHKYLFWSRLTIFTGIQCFRLEAAFRNPSQFLGMFFKGVARTFQRGGHRGYSPDCHVDIHAVHVWLNVTVLGWAVRVQWAGQAYKIYSSPKKTNFKEVSFSTMAFTAKTLSWRFRHLNITGCLLKRGPTKGESRTPQDPPPPPAPPASPLFLQRNV